MTDTAATFLCAGIALAISAAVAIPLPHFLIKGKFLDIPNTRSSHVVPTPRGGGWAVAIGSAVAIALVQPGRTVFVIAGCSIASGIVGLADDIRSLRAAHRLAAQILIGVFGGWLLVKLSSSGTSRTWSVWVTIPVLTLWVASTINAVNFMDGINGITATHAVISGGFLWWICSRNDLSARTAAAAICGACAGFLPHNAPVARLFLGDIGSYLIGCWLALTSAAVWLAGINPLVAVAPAATYLADTGWTLARRAARGAPLFEAHREHIYQQLSLILGGHPPAVVVYAATQLGVCAFAVGYEVDLASGPLMLFASCLLLVAYLLAPRSLARIRRIDVGT